MSAVGDTQTVPKGQDRHIHVSLQLLTSVMITQVGLNCSFLTDYLTKYGLHEKVSKPGFKPQGWIHQL